MAFKLHEMINTIEKIPQIRITLNPGIENKSHIWSLGMVIPLYNLPTHFRETQGIINYALETLQEALEENISNPRTSTAIMQKLRDNLEKAAIESKAKSLLLLMDEIKLEIIPLSFAARPSLKFQNNLFIPELLAPAQQTPHFFMLSVNDKEVSLYEYDPKPIRILHMDKSASQKDESISKVVSDITDRIDPIRDFPLFIYSDPSRAALLRSSLRGERPILVVPFRSGTLSLLDIMSDIISQPDRFKNSTYGYKLETNLFNLLKISNSQELSSSLNKYAGGKMILNMAYFQQLSGIKRGPSYPKLILQLNEGFLSFLHKGGEIDWYQPLTEKQPEICAFYLKPKNSVLNFSLPDYHVKGRRSQEILI